MNKNHRMALILGGVAVLLIIVSMSASNQGSTTSVGPRDIVIDFSIYPESHPDPIVVERGVAKSIPLWVEAPNDAEGTLQVQLASGLETIDPAQLNAELSQTTVVLSKLDLAEGKITELSSGRGIRDAGILTLNPPASMPPGEYTFMIEARQQANGELAPTLVSGAMIYVTVK
jgi:hypothetical protein